jgi:hypothetical protein
VAHANQALNSIDSAAILLSFGFIHHQFTDRNFEYIPDYLRDRVIERLTGIRGTRRTALEGQVD